jgi:NADPH:quinone reductase-like Zn-dependent oxidoreductase
MWQRCNGETVLVHAAAGGLGVVAVQIARAMGGAGHWHGGEHGEGRRREEARRGPCDSL